MKVKSKQRRRSGPKSVGANLGGPKSVCEWVGANFQNCKAKKERFFWLQPIHIYNNCPFLSQIKWNRKLYYANISCDCGQYTRIYSRGTLNCMDVLYFPTPTAESNITHPCNSRYRGEYVLVYLPQLHRIFAILYFNSKIINQN
jgi:hypothetical protein